jgi:hypothetical protein
VCGAAGRTVSEQTGPGVLVPSFVADGDRWAGAIYAIAPGVGPELLLVCGDKHRTMRGASDCATRDLEDARRQLIEAGSDPDAP